jgi:predicted PurR-regulated permease PerM
MNENDNPDTGWNLSLGLGVGALIGILASAIIGMLRLSRPKEPAGKTERPADESATGEIAQSQGMANPRTIRQPPAVADHPLAGVTHSPATRWSRGTKYFVAGILFLALIGLLYISSGSMSILIFAGLLSFIVHPVIRFFLRRLKLPRSGATVITYLLVLALIFLIPILIIPSVIEAIQFITGIDYVQLFQNLSDWISLQAGNIAAIPLIGDSLSSSLEELARILSDIGSQNLQSTTDLDISFQEIGGRIAQTLGFVAQVFGPVISVVTAVAFILLISLHMSLSVDLLRDGFKRLVPPAYLPEITFLVRRIVNIWQAFLRGQLSLMVIMGLLVWLGNEILGTPQALFLGILAGLFEVIPSLGPILATVPAVILALFFGSQTTFLGINRLEYWAFALIVLGFYILIQVLENQVLVPYILGDAVDLPPLFVIIGVVIGGSAFGLLGVFLATPVISTGRELFMYLYNKILEPPPESEPPEEKASILDKVRGYAARLLRRLPRPKSRQEGKPEWEDLLEEIPSQD